MGKLDLRAKDKKKLDFHALVLVQDFPGLHSAT